MTVFRICLFSIISCLLFSDKFSDAVTSYNLTISTNRSLIRYHWDNDENITSNWTNESSAIGNKNVTSILRRDEIDCFGLGSTVAWGLHWFLVGSCKECSSLDVRFYLTSRQQPQRVEVLVGKQFGLEWTDFQIERRTVIIVHGFLSHSNETWIKNMEKAFTLWGDVNVIVVDWSAGGNSWNYYKAVVLTKSVGHKITRFLGQIVNSTLDSGHTDPSNWGPIHLVGHSLGAHICGFVSHNFKRAQDKWIIKRITGLDPAQPCFNANDLTMQLDKTDAPFVDVIHTNGRLLSRLGLGLPAAIGHVDFYPNGGMKQPGCFILDTSFFSYLPISKSKIEETICSHGRSYMYLTESLINAASHNCTFWAHHWDMTYRGALHALQLPCAANNCSQMGITAEEHPQRGTFYVATAERSPFCVGDLGFVRENLIYLTEDLAGELDD